MGSEVQYDCTVTFCGVSTRVTAKSLGCEGERYAGAEGLVRSAVYGTVSACRAGIFRCSGDDTCVCNVCSFGGHRAGVGNGRVEVSGGTDGRGFPGVVSWGFGDQFDQVDKAHCVRADNGVFTPGDVLGGAGGSSSENDGTHVSSDREVDSGVCMTSVKGKHWKKNKRKSDLRKAKRGFVNSCVNEKTGYFSACSDDVQCQLRDTRAQMLVAQNKLKTVQSLAAVKEVQMSTDTRVNEVDFELKRLTLEDKLAKISEKRGIVQGTAHTIPSSTISSSSTTFLGGSISPSSSISMAEERKLRQDVVDQAVRLKDLEEELLRLRAGVPKTSKGRAHNVSEWTFKSPYDNFTVDGVHKSKLPGYVRDSSSGSYVDGGQDIHLSSHDY